MKSKSKVEAKLKLEEVNLKGKYILYECAGDYVRGYVAALKWVLDIPTND